MTDDTQGEPMRVCIITEGTYPFAMGGVSSWCHDLISALPDVEWHLMPITAGGIRRTPLFDIPPQATLHKGIELWSRPPGSSAWRRPARRSSEQALLPASMCRLLLGTADQPDELTSLFGRCRRDPAWARGAFRSKIAWQIFLEELRRTTQASAEDLFDNVEFTALEASELWQTLYWLTMTAATPLPESDALLLTAAGWGAAMAAAEHCHSGTPTVLSEHGIYVREAYLEAARTSPTPGRQFNRTRLARGLSQLSYAIADRITPVSDAHHRWETSLGADPAKLETIVNGVPAPAVPPPHNPAKIITSVGRIDPLKDVVTMLHTAAAVLERHPDARFVHWGPVSDENRAYYAMCLRTHEELQLGDRFTFMGPTNDPRRAMRAADIYLSTSISEGLPLSVLEAMTEARPVVATDVGGCAQAVNGCGVLANAGDYAGLAHGINFLLNDPDFAALMGRRGFRRAKRRFGADVQVEQYRSVLEEVAR